MKQPRFKLTVFSILIFSCISLYAQDVKVKPTNTEIWTKNCNQHDKYYNELIFTATQTGDKVSWVAKNRKEYISIFNGLVLDNEQKIKSRRDRILDLISKAQGGNSVIISKELNQEVDALWEDILTKAKSIGIKCE